MNRKYLHLFPKSGMVVVAMVFTLSTSGFVRNQALADDPPPSTHPEHWCRNTTCLGVKCLAADECDEGIWCEPDPNWNPGLVEWLKCLPKEGLNCNESGMFGVKRCPGLCSGGLNNGLRCLCDYTRCEAVNP
jgi:hypothetical protein